jgi:hypothetical protein
LWRSKTSRSNTVGRRTAMIGGFDWRLRNNFRLPLAYGNPSLIAGLSMKLESLNERAASNLSSRPCPAAAFAVRWS